MSSLDDAISILRCFTLAEPALSQTEVARRTNCPKATASRIMKTLREGGVLDFDPSTRLYTPGILLFELGQVCRSHHTFLDLVTTELEKVCAASGHTGYVTVFDGQQLVVLRMIRGSSPLAITSASTPGYRAWPHSTSNGRAMLALLSEEEWRHRVPDELPFVTASAPQSHEELRKKIRTILETGLSHSEGDSHDGVSAEAIAFRDPGSGEVIGVAVSYPSSVSTPEFQRNVEVLLGEMKAKLLLHA